MADGFKPYVPPETDMQEFTVRALIIGLVMCVVLGAANAYLGLKAGMTIAATYPAAVIGMALLRLMKGSILEENFARTVGSIGESVAAGAIFTLPAFFIAGIWPEFATTGHYLQSSAIMLAGGVLGIMFVALLRRVMVEDVELPFPESVAAAEIHKAGRGGGTGAKFLFGAMGIGAVIQSLAQIQHLRRRPGRSSSASPRPRSTCGRAAAPPRQSGAAPHLARRQPRVHRRRLHHRAQARLAELQRRPAGVGAAGPDPDVLHRPHARRRPRRRRTTDSLDRDGQQGVALHRAPDRHRRHARERGLHAVPDAQEPRRRDRPLHQRREEGGQRASASACRTEQDLQVHLDRRRHPG